MNRPPPGPMLQHFSLDPTLTFLNHGSFGATPRVVQAAQDAARALMEKDPVTFFVEHLWPAMDRTRAAIGAFVRADPACIAPVPNATFGVATAVAAVGLKAGDEILINDHEYPACINGVRREAARAGATVITAEIPFPIPSASVAAEAILSRVTPRTRAVLISHVTSSSGAILPVDRLVPALRAKGIETIVDGAHAPGFLPDLDLAKLAPTYYVANCHKWICSPKGSAFLYVDRAKRDAVRPLVLSNNAEKPRPGRDQFLTEFDYVGTGDVTAAMCIPDAIAFMGALLPGGWDELIRRNHALARAGRDLLCRELGVSPAVPDEMVGCISTIPLPAMSAEAAARLAQRPTAYHDALQDRLISRWRIQVPVWSVAGKTRVFRISAQVYNTLDQYAYLAHALKVELAEERRG